MSYWFPRLNAKGQVISGDGDILLDGRSLGPGYSPQWFDDDRVIIGDKAQLLSVTTGARQDLGYTFNPRVGNTSGICAGAGHWCGWSNADGIVYDDLRIDPAAAPGCIDQMTGALYYLTPYQADYRSVVLNGSIARQNVMASEMMAGENCVTWREYEGKVPILYGWSPETAAQRIWPLAPTEYAFTGVPVRTPSGLWLVTQTHKGLIIYPWGATEGYIIEGDYNYHHALWLDNAIRIVSTGAQGQFQDFAVNISDARTNLASYCPSTGTAPPIHSDAPPPLHTDSPHNDSVPEPPMDHAAMNQFANDWWAQNDIVGRSKAMGGNANDPNTGSTYCRPLQQWAFRRIMTEAYFIKGFNWALMFWKDGQISPNDDEATIQRKLHRVGEDSYCMLQPLQYKDAIGNMGLVEAQLNFNPPFSPSQPSDKPNVGPAPSLEFMDQHDKAPDGNASAPGPTPPDGGDVNKPKKIKGYIRFVDKNAVLSADKGAQKGKAVSLEWRDSGGAWEEVVIEVTDWEE